MLLSCPVSEIRFLGDSITWGAGATNPQHRWTTIVAHTLQATEINLGTAGSTLQRGAPIWHVMNPGRELIERIPQKTQPRSYLVLSYGFNDARYHHPNFTPKRFLIEALQTIAIAQQKGYASNEIVFSSAPWNNPVIYQPQHHNPIFYPWNNATVARINDYRFAALITTWVTGVKFADQAGATVGMIAADTVHPSNAGHAAIAKVVTQAICQ